MKNEKSFAVAPKIIFSSLSFNFACRANARANISGDQFRNDSEKDSLIIGIKQFVKVFPSALLKLSIMMEYEIY
jgi:hypothetical protein